MTDKEFTTPQQAVNPRAWVMFEPITMIGIKHRHNASHNTRQYIDIMQDILQDIIQDIYKILYIDIIHIHNTRQCTRQNT